MSRAININAPQEHVLASCARKNVGISAIETLRSGGTRVVTNNADDTRLLAKLYGTKVISGAVIRMPMRGASY